MIFLYLSFSPVALRGREERASVKDVRQLGDTHTRSRILIFTRVVIYCLAVNQIDGLDVYTQSSWKSIRKVFCVLAVL